MDPSSMDPLISLRRSIASGNPPIPTSSADPTPVTDAIENLAIASHLQFSDPHHHSFPLLTPTRFISSDQPVDLRSIYFAWQKKDVAIPDYIASAQQLNEELSAAGADGNGDGVGAGGKVQNLVFVERLDLITWLEGASDESEYIRALESETAAAATQSAKVAAGAAGSGAAAAVANGAHHQGGRAAKTVDPRLQEIYNGERRMGDHNSILRGIKPTDFSNVRKSAEVFLARTRPRANPNQPVSSTAAAIPTSTTAPAGAGGAGTPSTSSSSSLVSLPKKPSRRPDPIILLSPSASSLLRMSNIKSFLESGTYIPPDSALAGSSGASATILHISRLLPSIDAQRALRFILVDTPEQFKPDYWGRVVAVFTTGQTWQFKGYKWQSAAELFKNILGIYVGWRGEEVPATVKGWGRGVTVAQIEKWNAHMGVQGRWRDREVVEGIWDRVEDNMRAKGWGKEGGPAPAGGSGR